jgi:hypothetical protein
LIAALADRLPAFARAMESAEGLLRADLMLQNLDHACYHVACRDKTIGAETGARVVAEIVTGFLHAAPYGD